MSTRGLLLIAIIFIALLGGLYLWHKTPEYDPEELDRLGLIFDRKVASVRKGQPGYPLPDMAGASRELNYLAGLTRIMSLHAGDCSETEREILDLRRALDPLPAPSIFREAAREMERRRGEDFVYELSNEVHLGRSPTARMESPSDPDRRLELLQERADRVRMVDDGLRAINLLRQAGEAFADDCPLESAALQTALDYLPR